MALSKIRHVRAFVVRGGGADHDQGAGHWIDDTGLSIVIGYGNSAGGAEKAVAGGTASSEAAASAESSILIAGSLP